MTASTRGAHRSSPRLAVIVAVVLALVVVASLWLGPLAVLVAAACAPLHRRVARRRAAASRARAIEAALPESIDLCIVVLGAGGTIRDCVVALATHGPVAVRELARETVTRADGPEGLDRSLRRLQDQLGPPFQPLTGALLLAREQGGTVAPLLARLTVEANAGRRRRGELRARRLPVALLLPLITCSLPAVIIGTVVPLVAVAASGIEL